MDKKRIIPGQSYLHHRRIPMADRCLEAERWIRCKEITEDGAIFTHGYEQFELKDSCIEEELIKEWKLS